jgi:hypothetical protein
MQVTANYLRPHSKITVELEPGLTATYELREDGLHVKSTTETMSGDNRHPEQVVSFADLYARAAGQLTFV